LTILYDKYLKRAVTTPAINISQKYKKRRVQLKKIALYTKGTEDCVMYG